MPFDGARAATLVLLARRTTDATVCPSEVARALTIAAGLSDWRDAMPAVHAAVDAMIADGVVQVSWRGRRLLARDGPYRIGLAPARR